METQGRGRSPSVGHQPNQSIRSSPSPHDFDGRITTPTEFDTPPTNQPFTSQPFGNNNLSPTSNINYTLSNSYIDAGPHPQHFAQHQNVAQNSAFGGQNFEASLERNGRSLNSQHSQSPVNAQQSNNPFQADMLSVDTTLGGFPHQQPFLNKQDQFGSYDSLLDPQLQQSGSLQHRQQQPDQSINPADIMSNMSSPQNLAPSPPTLMPFNSQNSEPTSPFTNSGQQWSPHHSRQASLDPVAAYTNGPQHEWSNMLQRSQFQGHRRAPSEHSDVSSSVAPSPFAAQSDTFDPLDQNPSPLLDPEQDNQLYQDGLGIENFNISDNPPRHSPAHSPFISPHMSPQPGIDMTQEPTFIRLPEPQNKYTTNLAPEGYANQTEQFPTLPPEQRVPSNDYGQADQYDVPQINVETAPMPQQQVMENAGFPTNMHALSPPERGQILLSFLFLRHLAYRRNRTKRPQKSKIRKLHFTTSYPQLYALNTRLLGLLNSSPKPFALSVRHGCFIPQQLTPHFSRTSLVITASLVYIIHPQQGLHSRTSRSKPSPCSRYRKAGSKTSGYVLLPSLSKEIHSRLQSPLSSAHPYG